jgi:hypothetical protein
MESEDVDAYFEQKDEPQGWDLYRQPLTDYYR